MKRQFKLNQEIPDAIYFLMESPTSIQSFLRPTAFEFWSQRFTAVTIPGSLREGLCTPAMHGYWQAVMTSFKKELMGSRGFSLIPPDGLSAIISANPQLLLPSKSVLAYARKQSQSAIFEWDEEKRWWHWHAGDYPPGWEKKVKVTNIFGLRRWRLLQCWGISGLPSSSPYLLVLLLTTLASRSRLPLYFDFWGSTRIPPDQIPVLNASST